MPKIPKPLIPEELVIPTVVLVEEPIIERNREAWLNEMAKMIKPLFHGFKLEPYQLTCSWPTRNALGTRTRRVGECHSAESSPAGIHEIFISPLLNESLEVAGTVCHEVAHVAAGIPAGHGPQFKKVCRHVGLTKGKPTSAMPGPALNEQLIRFIESLGPYPHSGMKPVMHKVKPNNAISLRCVDCGCLVRITMSWIGKSGTPTCGCGGDMDVKVE